MKRSAVAILTIIYFAISSGVIVNIHYCMGKVNSVQLQTLAEKKCGCGKMSGKGCCKTELKLVKLEDAQKASYAVFAIHTQVILPVVEPNLLITSLYKPHTLFHGVHPPPLLSAQDTYLQNCVFRI